VAAVTIELNSHPRHVFVLGDQGLQLPSGHDQLGLQLLRSRMTQRGHDEQRSGVKPRRKLNQSTVRYTKLAPNRFATL
jgi:hypothetical protein